MDQLLNNHENAKESLPAFEKAFITLDNSMVIANNILIGYSLINLIRKISKAHFRGINFE